MTLDEVNGFFGDPFGQVFSVTHFCQRGINHKNGTIEFTKAVAKAASVFGSKAYNDLNEQELGRRESLQKLRELGAHIEKVESEREMQKFRLRNA